MVGILGANLIKSDNNIIISSQLTLADVAKHNTSADCWVIVNNKVYDMTSYLPMHPAGLETITPYCGKDATTAFNTKNGKGPHSQRAEANLNNFYVGSLQ